MKIAGIVQEFTPYARALWEANKNGRITLEGSIKGEDTFILGMIFSLGSLEAFFLVLQF